MKADALGQGPVDSGSDGPPVPAATSHVAPRDDAARDPVAAGVTDRGSHRPNNEDCYRIDQRLKLYLVADGMGGHVAGEIASRLAADAVVETLNGLGGAGDDTAAPGVVDSEVGGRLRLAVETAHLRLIEAGRADSSLAGMGTTLVAAQVSEGRLTVASVGDSRLYLFDGHSLRQVTRDDSWIEAMLRERPDADRATLRAHPLCHALTNVLSTTGRAEVHITEVPLAGGEVIALTTDGVHGTLGAEQIAGLLAGRLSPAQAAAGLVAAAIDSGSSDNCTAVVATC